jgi:hypothetical protein
MPTDFEVAFLVEEQRNDQRRPLIAEGRSVSPEYFGTMQIPLLGGELCRRHGNNAAGGRLQRDAMVNRAFVDRYFAGSSPIGLHLSQPNGPFVSRVVGIVGDARERGLDREAGPIVYWCDSAPNPTPYFLVRTSTEPATVAQAVRVAMKGLDPTRAMYELGTLDERLGGAYAQHQLRTMLLVVFAATALLLAAVGVYGTLSYMVSLRRREVALRLALGAVNAAVRRQFLLEGLRIIAPACVLGIVASVALSRLLVSMLFGISAADPAVLLTVPSIVLAVGTLAALLPALRASRLQAMDVLREV